MHPKVTATGKKAKSKKPELKSTEDTKPASVKPKKNVATSIKTWMAYLQQLSW
jgi:hypothetical protein